MQTSFKNFLSERLWGPPKAGQSAIPACLEMEIAALAHRRQGALPRLSGSPTSPAQILWPASSHCSPTAKQPTSAPPISTLPAHPAKCDTVTSVPASTYVRQLNAVRGLPQPPSDRKEWGCRSPPPAASLTQKVNSNPPSALPSRTRNWTPSAVLPWWPPLEVAPRRGGHGLKPVGYRRSTLRRGVDSNTTASRPEHLLRVGFIRCGGRHVPRV
jgi:hypothetical protein